MSPPSNASRKTRQSKSSGQVRIIAGQWRGRKLVVPDLPGLRPTGDRVRETVFNWLQPYLAASHCLDLYAGSGALGFEALSRYAASLTFVEPSAVAVGQLKASARLLVHDALSIEKTTAERFLAGNDQRFDMVFIDPPFDLAVQWETLATLVPRHVRPGARIYVESPTSQDTPDAWPAGITLLRDKQFGDVTARLFQYSEEQEASS